MKKPFIKALIVASVMSAKTCALLSAQFDPALQSIISNEPYNSDSSAETTSLYSSGNFEQNSEIRFPNRWKIMINLQLAGFTIDTITMLDLHNTLALKTKTLSEIDGLINGALNYCENYFGGNKELERYWKNKLLRALLKDYPYHIEQFEDSGKAK